MFDRLLSSSLGAKVSLLTLSVALLLGLAGCGGSSNSSSTVITSGPPNITGLSATKGVVGAAVTITGSNFGSTQGSSSVTFNGTAASIVSGSWSNTSIIARVPAGASSGSVVVNVGGIASNAISFSIETPASGSIASTGFGFQCSMSSNACGPNASWPVSVAEPNLLRLWDCGTGTLGQGCRWPDIEFTAPGVYTWTYLDTWLDSIAAQEAADPWGKNSLQVIYTFGFVSCQEIAACVSGGLSACTPAAYQLPNPKGCTMPPDDFTSSLSGSPSFNNFVTALVQHCSPNGNCVKDLIKNYEMWNEPNNPYFWHDTTSTGELEVYQMVYPATQIIRANVPNAVIMTMASTAVPSYTAQWLAYESQYGVGGCSQAGAEGCSDVVAWHQYLNNDQTEVIPEDSGNLQTFTSLASTAVAANKPWRVTETGWQAYDPPYACNGNGTSNFSSSDCIGQMVRWQLLVLSSGGQGLDWYTWDVNIGSQPQYAIAWASMMNYLVGGTFSAPCAVGSDGSTWTCPFTEADGTKAQWVWTTNEGGDNYTVPTGYVDYVDLAGDPAAPVSAGGAAAISVSPLLFEQ